MPFVAAAAPALGHAAKTALAQFPALLVLLQAVNNVLNSLASLNPLVTLLEQMKNAFEMVQAIASIGLHPDNMVLLDIQSAELADVYKKSDTITRGVLSSSATSMSLKKGLTVKVCHVISLCPASLPPISDLLLASVYKPGFELSLQNSNCLSFCTS